MNSHETTGLRSITRRDVPLAAACCAFFGALSGVLSGAGAAAQELGPLFPAQSYFTMPMSAMVVGDLNGDGLPDIAALGQGPSVSILLNNHQGEMLTGPAPNTVPLAFAGTSIARGDLDGDGDLDLVVPLTSGHGLAVILNHGDGSFDAPVVLPQAHVLSSIVLADFTGDGILDYAVTVASLGQVDLGRGLGNATFDAPVGVPTGGLMPNRLAVADLDGVHGPDLVIGHSSSAFATVLLDQGSGTFATAAPVPAVVGILGLALTDLDGDLVTDVVLVNSASSGDVRVQFVLGHGDGTFGAPAYLPKDLTAGVTRDPVAGDLDGDGDTDLAFTWGSSSDMLGLLMQMPGGFTGPLIKLRVGYAPVAAAIADFNGDGWPDVAAATDVEASVAVVLGTGGPGFVDLPKVFPVGGAVSAMDVRDMNADGLPDFVFVHVGPEGDTVSVMLADGEGSLGAPVVAQVTGNIDGAPEAVVADDFDGDGIADVCNVDSSGYRANVLLGHGDGTFGPQADFPTWYSPTAITSGDLDGDLLPDLVLLHKQDAAVSVMLGTGGGAFARPQPYTVGVSPIGVALADLDDDGALDLVVASADTADVTVLHNDGAGSFSVSQVLPLPAKPTALAVFDADGNGTPDLACALIGSVWVERSGLGDGSFDTTGPAFAGTWSFATDVNLDGLMDLVGRSSSPSRLQVILGAGRGAFDVPRHYLVSTSTLMAIADFSGDGSPDLLAAGSTKELTLGHLDPTWIDLGHGLAGSLGQPLLHGTGTLAGGNPVTLSLSFAKPGSMAALFIGLSGELLPFKGGTLVPAPLLVAAGLPVNGAGKLALGANWPTGLPSGLSIFFQEWVVDAAGPAGLSASNGVRATTP